MSRTRAGQHGRVHSLALRVGFGLVGFTRQFEAPARGIDAGLGVMKSAPGQAVDKAFAIGEGILQRRVVADPVTIVIYVFVRIDDTAIAVGGLRVIAGGGFHRVRVKSIFGCEQS